MTMDAGAAITGGRTALGIELGSTRIKAVLIGPDHAPLAVGTHDWENQFVDRLWTYSLDAVWAGLDPDWEPAQALGTVVVKDRTVLATGPDDQKLVADMDGTYFLDGRT